MKKAISGLALFLIATVSAGASPLVSWTYTGVVEYSSTLDVAVNEEIAGSLAFDPASTGEVYNAGKSGQYWGAVKSLNLTLPAHGVTYELINGDGHVSIQDGAFGNYEATLYANTWTGGVFSSSGGATAVSGIGLFFRSFSDFLAPNGAGLPTAPFDISAMPYTWNQNGQGATFEYYPDGGYVRGRILTLAAVETSVPEPSSALLIAAGALAGYRRRGKRHTTMAGG